jgi:hypothetical protein
MQKLDFTFQNSARFNNENIVVSTDRQTVGFDYVHAKVLDDRVNSDVDENADNFNMFTNLPGYQKSLPRKKVQDQYSLAKDRLFEKDKEVAFEKVTDPRAFDTMKLTESSSKYHVAMRELIHKTEGLDMADFDHDDDTEMFLIYTDILECYS